MCQVANRYVANYFQKKILNAAYFFSRSKVNLGENERVTRNIKCLIALSLFYSLCKR